MDVPTPSPNYGASKRDLLKQTLKAQRYEDAPHFLEDLSVFLKIPINPMVKPVDMLKVLIGKAEERMGKDTWSPAQGGALKRREEEAFVNKLEGFLELCALGEKILKNKRDGTHDDVRKAVSDLQKKEPPAPSESDRKKFLERIYDYGHKLSGSGYYQMATVITKSRPTYVKGVKQKAVRPHEMFEYLNAHCKEKKQPSPPLHDIRREAQSLGVVFEPFPVDEDTDYPSEVSFVKTRDGHYLQVNRQAKLIQCDPQ